MRISLSPTDVERARRLASAHDLPEPVISSRLPTRLAHHRARVAQNRLTRRAPAPIRQRFETAKQLVLFAWFVPAFAGVGERQLYEALQQALEDRLTPLRGERPLTPRQLLTLASRQRLLDGARLHEDPDTLDWHRPTPAARGSTRWVYAYLRDSFLSFRAAAPRDDTRSVLTVGRALSLVTDLLNHLYPGAPADPATA